MRIVESFRNKSFKGTLANDECFGYVPLFCLGREEHAENLRKVNALEYMELILAVGGPFM